MASGVELTDSIKGSSGIVLDFPVNGSSASSGSSSSPVVKVPRRVRQRLMESKSPSTITVEEIENKLKEADQRRQQFHEWLSSKARPKPRSPSWSSSQDEDLGQRLEAKLYAAEQKRLSILAKAQTRLARLDELRQAAKTEVELRSEKEREELGTKVESRVQQAEENRMLLLKAHKQRRAAAKERRARLLLQRMVEESKYKECIHEAICQKRAAAEKKRLGLLEAEQKRTHTRLMQVKRVAKFVHHQREFERRRIKRQLEDRLQRARNLRAEYLRQRGSLHTSVRVNWYEMHKQGDYLSRKLARCWRQFVNLKKTTFTLAKEYDALEITQKTVKLMPFEHLAVQIESATTIQTVKALLDRFETRLTIYSASRSESRLNDIEHLLKRLSSPKRKGRPSNTNRNRGTKNVGSSAEAAQTPTPTKLSRYPVRLVLCAYMILGHPDAVFSGQGEREISLTEAATTFIQEFEMLINVVLNGPPNSVHKESTPTLPGNRAFRVQLEAFDAAWCSYLYRFVVWKVKDAKSLEEDLVRAACQLEFSMMQKCKLTPEGGNGDLSHDLKAIQNQVTEDQRLLREKVQHLGGDAGIERMESALSDTRSKFFEAKENGGPMIPSVAHILSPGLPGSSTSYFSVSEPDRGSKPLKGGEPQSHIVRALFKDTPSPSKEPDASTSKSSIENQLGSSGVNLSSENELLVNEIVHEHRYALADSFNVISEDQNGIKAKIKETMQNAFWDSIAESMKQDEPEYGRIVELVKEVRDELCEMAPRWREEIFEAIDIDILSQVLKSGARDMDYLGNVLEYALVTLQKLSAPANEDDMKHTHKKLLNELADVSRSGDKSSASFVTTTIKGLRFVLEQIQDLKQEISKAHIRIMEPLIKGPAGLEYLKKAFQSKYGSPSDASTSLPMTKQWFASLRSSSTEQEWNEHRDSLSTLTTSHLSASQGLPPATALRSGGVTPTQSQLNSHRTTSTTGKQPECKGDKVDLLIRLGLLKLVSGIDGITQETLPETLKLNFSRLRAAQSQLQKIIVISTSMLVLRQILMSQSLTTSQADMEYTIANSFKGLSQLLDSKDDVGVAEIVEKMIEVSEGAHGTTLNNEKLKASKEVMANLLVKSLLEGDAVFERISRAVYLAVRGAVLGGSGPQGRTLAETALRRVGALALIDRVMQVAEVLIVVATVSTNVHGPWYAQLAEYHV